jgi:transcriptional regulator with XRE-family HTH domain
MMDRGTQSLGAEEADRVRARLEELTQRRGEQAKIARRLGVTPQAISKIVTRKSDPGVRVARALADLLGMSLDELLGKREREVESEPRLSSLPGWAECEATARERQRQIADEVWQAIAGLRAPRPPDYLSPDFVVALALAWAPVLAVDPPSERASHRSRPPSAKHTGGAGGGHRDGR